MNPQTPNLKTGNKLLLLFICMLCFTTISKAQGTWTPVATGAPHYNDGVMLLLTDGTVLVKTSSGSDDVYGNTWDRLIPDIHGSYVNGTWTTISPMFDSRLYFSTQVLKDGTIYLAGGEYGTGRSFGEIYNPAIDEWRKILLPLATDTISDANSEILNDGKVLQAVVLSGTTVSHHTYIYDPVTYTYSVGPTTIGVDNESAWVKLPDNSFIFVDVYSTNSERYIPASNTWVGDASVPVELYDPYGYETGAAFLLPDRRAFFLGSSSTTAFYTPSGTTSHGTWATGPVIPDSLGAPDAAAAMMVNGHILCAFSHTPILDTVFLSPMEFYDFNYLTDSFTRILAPGGADTIGKPSYQSNMLCLPDGTVLYASQGDDQYSVFTPTGGPLAAGKPTINNIVRTATCDSFLAIGKLFNGITEGAAYGDDWQMATNYPLIRLSSNDTVYYAFTYGWNSTGVRRDSLSDSTYFVIPSTIPPGNYSLCVVANGIASDSIAFTVCDPAGVQNITAVKNAINVYPNPASNFATVEFDAKNGGAYNIKLQDIFGRTTREKNGVAVAGTNTYQLPLNGVAKGIYTITIRSEAGVYNTKLVVE